MILTVSVVFLLAYSVTIAVEGAEELAENFDELCCNIAVVVMLEMAVWAAVVKIFVSVEAVDNSVRVVLFTRGANLAVENVVGSAVAAGTGVVIPAILFE